MTRRFQSPKPSPEHFEQLHMVADSGEALTPDILDANAEVKSPTDVDGISVSIAARAIAFAELFDTVNQIRSSEGLQKFSQTGGATQLEQRYGRKTDTVLTGSAARAEEAEARLKPIFARASGLNEMLEAGEDPVQAKATTRRMYNNFSRRYGIGQPDAKTRSKKAKQIEVSAGVIAGDRHLKSGRLKVKKSA